MLIGMVTFIVVMSNSKPSLETSLPLLSMRTKGTSAVRVMVSSSPPISAYTWSICSSSDSGPLMVIVLGSYSTSPAI